MVMFDVIALFGQWGQFIKRPSVFDPSRRPPACSIVFTDRELGTGYESAEDLFLEL